MRFLNPQSDETLEPDIFDEELAKIFDLKNQSNWSTKELGSVYQII